MESLSGQSLIPSNLGRVDDEEMMPTAHGLSQCTFPYISTVCFEIWSELLVQIIIPDCKLVSANLHLYSPLLIFRLAKVGSLTPLIDSPSPMRNIKRIIYSKLQINRASLYSDAAIEAQNSSWQGARGTPVVGLEHHTGDSTNYLGDLGEIPREDDRWRHYLSPPPQFRYGTEWERNILQSPCNRDLAHKTFGPSDLTSTYSVCTRRVFGGIGHQTHAFRSGVRCSNH
ncbi:hypothetical protein TNCV_2723441 [Trichonephila clavipes]|nr:hypothetical protein TNCV_2723441 [Trichonephila clavipes]